ncbi:hypothetical protein [Actinomadura litoris]|uniref:hypothetical protein n=1 Tax=Actinomadura litoris TaxID=2678616 RepID=UPI0012E194B2|nr:hypothetical protein [Actinomadura litoris]
MGFLENAGKAIGALGRAIGDYEAARNQAQYLLTMSEDQAKLRLHERAREDRDPVILISRALKEIARTDSGDRADLAARLALFADGLV